MKRFLTAALLALAVFTARPETLCYFPIPQLLYEGLSPVILSNRIIFPVDIGGESLVCVEKNGGAKQWQIRTPIWPRVWCVDGGRVLVTAQTNFFWCDPKTGELEKLAPAIGVQQVDSIIDGTIATVSAGEPQRGLVLRIAKTWRTLWSRPDVWQVLHRDARGILVLLASEGWFENAASPYSGSLHLIPKRIDFALLSASTGETQWSIQTRAVPKPATTALLTNSVLVTAGGYLSIVSRADGVKERHRLDANTNAVLPVWQHDGVPFIVLSNQVYRINTARFQLIEKYHVPQKPVLSATQHDQFILIETDREIHGLNTETGQSRLIAPARKDSDHRRWLRLDNVTAYYNDWTKGLMEVDIRSGDDKVLYKDPSGQIPENAAQRLIDALSPLGIAPSVRSKN